MPRSIATARSSGSPPAAGVRFAARGLRLRARRGRPGGRRPRRLRRHARPVLRGARDARSGRRGHRGRPVLAARGRRSPGGRRRARRGARSRRGSTPTRPPTPAALFERADHAAHTSALLHHAEQPRRQGLHAGAARRRRARSRSRAISGSSPTRSTPTTSTRACTRRSPGCPGWPSARVSVYSLSKSHAARRGARRASPWRLRASSRSRAGSSTHTVFNVPGRVPARRPRRAARARRVAERRAARLSRRARRGAARARRDRRAGPSRPKGGSYVFVDFAPVLRGRAARWRSSSAASIAACCSRRATGSATRSARGPASASRRCRGPVSSTASSG